MVLVQESKKLVCRAAIYARYSSDMQNPASAIDQIDRIRHYVERERIRLIKFPLATYSVEFCDEWIVKDEAETGKVATREGYDYLVNQGIKNNRFEVLFVDDLSRLTRSLGNQIRLYDLLRFRGIELYSLSEGISSESPNAKVYFQVKGLVNEIGNDLNALRTKRGQEARVLKGFSAGDICYGYGSRPTQIRVSGGREIPSHYEIFISPEQAKVVNLIFDLKIKGLGCSAIARYLNERKIPSTDRGRKMSGRECNWNNTGIRKILTREKYIGVWKWGKTSRQLNPETQSYVQKSQPTTEWVEHNGGKEIREDLIIVSLEKWEKVQAMFAKTTTRFREARDKVAAMNEAKQVALRSGTLLAGILFCSECRSPMLQITGRRGGYYGCFMHYRKDASRCSNKRLLNREKVEGRVIETLKAVLLDPGHLDQAAKLMNEIIRKKLQAAPEELRILERKKADVAKEVTNLMKFIMSHGDTSSAVKEALAEKEMEGRYVDQRIRTLKTASADKLFVTPFSLRAQYERLAECFQKEPVVANGHLKKLFGKGLECSPSQRTFKKNHNQHNSLWKIKGTLFIGSPDGFSKLEFGGDGGSRTHVRKPFIAKIYMLIQCFRLSPGRPLADFPNPPQT